MKVYVLIFALLLPSVLSQAYVNRVFRRARSSHLRSSPRQLRYSRYIQDNPAQLVEQQEQHAQDVQQKSSEDIEEQQDLEQMINNFSQTPLTEKTTKSYASNGFTKAPTLYQTSTPKTSQFKDTNEDLVAHVQSSFEEGVEQNYMTQQQQNPLPYSPMKQLKQNGNGHGTNGHGTNGGNGHSLGTGASFSGESDFESSEFGSEDEHDHNGVDWLRSSIRGEPGQDYPVLDSVPATGFRCDQQQFPGYYADMEAQCQAFHFCQPDGRVDDFLCPNGTIFSQRHFVCVWWFDFDCNSTPEYYELNSELYKETEAKQISGGDSGSFGGNVESVTESSVGGRLSSPKANLNQMYKSQIDDFNGNGHGTGYSGNGHSLSGNGYGSNGHGNGYSGNGHGSNGNGYSGNGRGSNGNGYSGNGHGSNGKGYSGNGHGSNGNGYSGNGHGYSGNGNGHTTLAPGFYSNGKTTMQVTNRYKPTTAAVQYADSPDSVTPSSILSSPYETTPFNLEEALGEEIHSETPLIESLPLTTNTPYMGEMETFGDIPDATPKKSMMDFYSGKFTPKPTTPSYAGNGYSANGGGKKLSGNGSSAKPSYGGVKGGKTANKLSQAKMSQFPESPVKSGRNGNGIYSAPPTGLKNGKSNGFKSYSPSYGTKQ